MDHLSVIFLLTLPFTGDFPASHAGLPGGTYHCYNQYLYSVPSTITAVYLGPGPAAEMAMSPEMAQVSFDAMGFR